jgi:hypothetical protein
VAGGVPGDARRGAQCRCHLYGTLLGEAAFPLVVWFRPLRLYVLAAVAALHLGIALFMQNLVFFSLAMVCSFWLFVPPETTRRIRGGVARLFRRPEPRSF